MKFAPQDVSEHKPTPVALMYQKQRGEVFVQDHYHVVSKVLQPLTLKMRMRRKRNFSSSSRRSRTYFSHSGNSRLAAFRLPQKLSSTYVHRCSAVVSPDNANRECLEVRRFGVSLKVACRDANEAHVLRFAPKWKGSTDINTARYIRILEDVEIVMLQKHSPSQKISHLIMTARRTRFLTWSESKWVSHTRKSVTHGPRCDHQRPSRETVV